MNIAHLSLFGFDILGGLKDLIGGWLTYIFEAFSSIFIVLVDGIFYGIQIGFFAIMDFIQTLFRKVAGLDTYYYKGQASSGDMAIDFIFNPTVQGVFWSVMAVAVVLLFVTTFVAIIRSEITEKGSNPKGPIIGKALKSILYFAMVPIVSLVGIIFANILLRTLDKATQVNQTSTLSGMVFQAAAAQACRADESDDRAKEFAKDFGVAYTTREDVTNTILKAYASGESVTIRSDPGSKGYMFPFVVGLIGASAWNAMGHEVVMKCDPSNFVLTYYYFDLLPVSGYDYLIGFIGGFIACSFLLTSILGCMQRLFEITILFVISPPIISMMPIDNGSRYNTWRSEFVKRVLACYGPIIGLNLMFMILTIIGDYTLFPDTLLYALPNALVKMFFMIVALLSLKDFTGLITSLVGGSDVSAMGEGKKGDTTKMAGQILNAGKRIGKPFAAAGLNVAKGAAAGAKAGWEKTQGENGNERGYFSRGLHALGGGLKGGAYDAPKGMLKDIGEKAVKDSGNLEGLSRLDKARAIASNAVINNKDGLISNLIDISGVGKGLKDKAITENPNSIAAAFMGDGAKKRADAKAADDAVKAVKNEAANKQQAIASIDSEIAKLQTQLDSGKYEDGMDEAKAKKGIEDLTKQRNFIEKGGSSDAFGVATNIQDIERVATTIAERLANLKVTIANPGEVGKDDDGDAGKPIEINVFAALQGAAQGISSAAESMKKSAQSLSETAEKLKPGHPSGGSFGGGSGT